MYEILCEKLAGGELSTGSAAAAAAARSKQRCPLAKRKEKEEEEEEEAPERSYRTGGYVAIKAKGSPAL